MNLASDRAHPVPAKWDTPSVEFASCSPSSQHRLTVGVKSSA